GDQVYVLVPHTDIDALEELFGGMPAAALRRQPRFFGDFVLPASCRCADLAAVYDAAVPPSDDTLAALFERRYGDGTVVGDRVTLGRLVIIARRVDDGRVAEVGLKLPA